MKRIVVVLFIFLFFPLNGFTEEPPLEFKGIALGSHIDTIKADSRYECKKPKNHTADQVCTLKFRATETIAGAPVKIIALFYYDDTLDSMMITFQEKYFSDVVLALKEKYGPVKEESRIVQNKMGATFENKIYTWWRSEGKMVADRFSYDLETSALHIMSKAGASEFGKRKEKSIKEKAGDL